MLTGGLQGCCFQQLLPLMAAACLSTLYLRCSHCILRLLVSSTPKGSLPVSKTNKTAPQRLSETAQWHLDRAHSPLTKCNFYISPVLPLRKKKRCYRCQRGESHTVGQALIVPSSRAEAVPPSLCQSSPIRSRSTIAMNPMLRAGLNQQKYSPCTEGIK